MFFQVGFFGCFLNANPVLFTTPTFLQPKSVLDIWAFQLPIFSCNSSLAVGPDNDLAGLLTKTRPTLPFADVTSQLASVIAKIRHTCNAMGDCCYGEVVRIWLGSAATSS